MAGYETPIRAALRRMLPLGLVLLAVLLTAQAAWAIRVKDVAFLRGARDNQLIGYGLVVGLSGSGDKRNTEFTLQSLASMLAKMGIGVDPELIQVKNVAAVMVTADLAPFARTGARMDVLLSSIGDATSLEGGTLLMTPLFGANGEGFAIVHLLVDSPTIDAVRIERAAGPDS